MKNIIVFSAFLFLISVIIAQDISYGQGRSGVLSFDSNRVSLVSGVEKVKTRDDFHPNRHVRMFTFKGVRCITVERDKSNSRGIGVGIGLSCDWD